MQQAAEDTERVETAGGRASSPHAMDGSMASMAMQTWARRCMGCHGQIGSGDGPQAEGLNVPDLSAASWQARVSDEEIAKVIQLGKGKMPGVALEPPVVTELVGLVRRMVVKAPPPDRSVTAPPQTNQPKP